MKVPSEPPPSDRRANERHLACFPASVQRPDGETRTSLIRDLSVTGALLFVRTSLEVGDRVELKLHLNEENIDDARDVRAEVIRVEPLPDDAVGMWRRQVAVKFDAGIDIDSRELDAIRRRQERLGAR